MTEQQELEYVVFCMKLTLDQIRHTSNKTQRAQTARYSNVATGSNTSYTDVCIGDKILWHQHTHL